MSRSNSGYALFNKQADTENIPRKSQLYENAEIITLGSSNLNKIEFNACPAMELKLEI
ncbi:MAG: hypothetical protein ACTSWL_01840 [Promethearchaeota archaeon]